MNTPSILAAFLLVILMSCQKDITDTVTDTPAPPVPVQQGMEYYIAKGAHYSDKNPYKAVTVSEMKFTVKFNNSAIYQTIDTNNQRDINKLYGFSDNNQDHHTNSARIGWRWYNHELQLYAYIYNNTVQSDKLITAVSLNKEIPCSIKAEGSNYTFTVDGHKVIMNRASTTPLATGYQLYPYFGGDEVAPQDIRILIRDI